MSLLADLTEFTSALLVAILFAICFSALIVLVLVIFKKTPRPAKKRITRTHNSCEIKMLMPASPNSMKDSSDDTLSNNSDDEWGDSANRIVPHCMGVLANCRKLTDRLTSVAINSLDEWDPQMHKLVEIAKLITARVDHMVSCMNPPLNSEQLVGDASSLTLAVAQMAIVVQNDTRLRNISGEWITTILNRIQRHIDMIKNSSIHERKNSNTKAKSREKPIPSLNSYTNGHCCNL